VVDVSTIAPALDAVGAFFEALHAEQWDAAADHLVAENRAIAALLGDDADESSFRVSALKSENDRLRTLLIAAHVAAEAAGDVARQAAIWAELAAGTDRRNLANCPF